MARSPVLRAAWLAAAFGLAAGSAAPARAALEEFENWSIAARELDDENGLDDLQRSFAPWEDWRWRDARHGARVGMGCATTQVWEVNLDTKIRHALGDRAEAVYDRVQRQELGESIDLSEFGGSGWTSGGVWLGGFYRPAFSKERHAAGLFVGLRRAWERRVRLRLGLEDVLNNFWDRRTRYIEDKNRRGYEKRPYEWDLSGRWERAGLGRAAWRAVWLPEYRRSFEPGPSETLPPSVRTANGWLIFVDLASEPGRRGTLGFRTRVKGTDRLDVLPETSARDDARLRDFWLRPWFDLALAERWRLRGIAQARWSSEKHHDGDRDHVLETRHLGGLGVVVWSPFAFLDLGAGLGVDGVRVERDAAPEQAIFTHGTRTEARAVFSVDLHWKGARIVLTETIEGNNEGYQTVGLHDKGFARLSLEL